MEEVLQEEGGGLQLGSSAKSIRGSKRQLQKGEGAKAVHDDPLVEQVKL